MPTDVFGLFEFGKSPISFMDQVQYLTRHPVPRSKVKETTLQVRGFARTPLRAVPISTVVYVTVDKVFLNVAILLHFHKYLKQIIHNITYDLHCENIELL